MNEIFITVFLLALIGSSDFNESTEGKERLGQVPLVAVSCNIFVNFIRFVINTKDSIRRSCRKRRGKTIKI
jgi:hypothetical protein